MKENILVTGFGPFGEHKINASWEAVKLLNPNSFPGHNLIVEEIPVIYSCVEKNVPLLWTKYDPKLVVHVGVSAIAKSITIETRAYRGGYIREDCGKNVHPTGEICLANGTSSVPQDCLKTCLDVEQICESINNMRKKFNICSSKDAGRYLCEFIYYSSLAHDCRRSLFVHVPPLNKPYSAEELAEGITLIILCALENLRDDSKNSESCVRVFNK